VQYRTDANLAARQSIYAYQHPPLDLHARVLDLAAPAPGEVVADVGCGNGAYLAGLAGRGFAGRVLGADLSAGMLAAARQRAQAALVVADAAALPLRDGAADLTLACHMLYHVPDPAVAVRELRRVTRPGGRVVVVLNGADHLAELRALIAEADGPDAAPPGERLRLDSGEALLRTVFSSVTRHDFAGELLIPEVEPIEAYVRSMSRAQALADPAPLIEAVLAKNPNAPIRNGPDGLFRVRTHAGCLVCG
jgi:SAM-dependent methyltransferase